MEEEIKQKRNSYFLEDAPRIIDMKPNQVYINKYAPCPAEQASFDDFISYWEEARVLTHKLRVKSYGDWEMQVAAISKSHLESRHELDTLFLKHSGQEVNESEFESWERISMRRAIAKCRVEITCNMDYYFEHASELEADLGRKVNVKSVKEDAYATRMLEQELFYKHMCKLFGAETENEEEDDSIKWSEDEKLDDDEDWQRNIYEKVYMIKEFTILSLDGNSVFCTARRGQSYILFKFLY
jgi:hypothetical protein